MKQTILLGILSALGIGITFAFQWYILVTLGPGLEADALFASTTIPQLVLAVISASLMHVLVPLLAGEEETKVRADTWRLFYLIGSLFSAIAALLYLTTPWWVPVILPGFDQDTQTLTIELVRIQLISMVFTALNGLLWAYHHAERRFISAEFAPILSNTVSFGLLVWALPIYGIHAAAWLLVLRTVLQTLMLAPGLGLPVKPTGHSDITRLAWNRIKPLLLGSAYYKTDPLIDRYLLSSANSGSLSLYYLAQQIYGAISQVINKAIAAPLVPAMSVLRKSGNSSELRRIFYRKLFLVFGVSTLGLLIVLLLGHTILTLLLSYGAITYNDIDKLWWIMVWLGGVLIGGSTSLITMAAFYAIGDTATPARMSMLTYTVYIPVKLTAFFIYGISGLALTTTVYFMINLLLQMYLLKDKL